MTEKRTTIWGKWLILIGAVILCNIFFLRLAFVFGQSMEPTLEQYDCVVVWRWMYTPQNGDIVVTNAKNALKQSLIKRVIATEGQEVCVQAGQIYVDKKLVIDECAEEAHNLKVIVPQGHVFLIGDNPARSVDSRAIGCIPNENLIGKVVARIFPFQKITFYFNGES